MFLELGFPCMRPNWRAAIMLTGLAEFREHLGGQLTILLLERDRGPGGSSRNRPGKSDGKCSRPEPVPSVSFGMPVCSV